MSGPSTSAEAKAVGSFLVTITILLTSMGVSALDLLGDGVLPGAVSARLGAYRAIWPQKWSFFTNLDGESPVPYRVGPDLGLTPLYGHRVWDERLAGLRRHDDAREVETRRLALAVPERYWQECGRLRSGRCERDLAPDLVHEVDNPVARPGLCGRVAVALERVAPPAPRTIADGPRQVFRLALLDVRCPS
ncbi:hypothetical protein [Saccharothrix australiensis]|uniref:Antimicrobial peptide system SdpA family protein n=1 Tax=Saccharothrix australiensis TaxID=2072 RepID=A0A495VYZ9_9PSEU|nr:hypothetical protein [Saccharothrix australiensis]RKT54652.1 hypothetical protein C8E97_3299 [Saccharothrix australiensis]